jgi:hypothetical protein
MPVVVALFYLVTGYILAGTFRGAGVDTAMRPFDLVLALAVLVGIADVGWEAYKLGRKR